MFSVACTTLKCKTCLHWQSCWSSSTDWCWSLHSKVKIIKYYKYIKKTCVADKQEQTKTFREEFTTWLRFSKDSSQALKWFTRCNSEIKLLLHFWKPETSVSSEQIFKLAELCNAFFEPYINTLLEPCWYLSLVAILCSCAPVCFPSLLTRIFECLSAGLIGVHDEWFC